MTNIDILRRATLAQRELLQISKAEEVATLEIYYVEKIVNSNDSFSQGNKDE